jgi:hypothetical protein
VGAAQGLRDPRAVLALAARAAQGWRLPRGFRTSGITAHTARRGRGGVLMRLHRWQGVWAHGGCRASKAPPRTHPLSLLGTCHTTPFRKLNDPAAHWTGAEGFAKHLQPYQTFPQRRHGRGPRSRNLPGRSVRPRRRCFLEPHPTPHARRWESPGTEERLRGALPGSRGPGAPRRAREKRAGPQAFWTKTSATCVPDCAYTACRQPSIETPVGSVPLAPRRRGCATRSRRV